MTEQSYTRKYATIMFCVCILICVIVIFGSLIDYGNKYIEYQSSLSEMSDGVYAIYYTTHSSIPACNYEVVTVCCNGNICTFTGDVNISFTSEQPCVMVKQYNMVNADDIYVYVPQGTVVYQQSVNIGK